VYSKPSTWQEAFANYLHLIRCPT